jgi:CHAD domain-containing protein
MPGRTAAVAARDHLLELVGEARSADEMVRDDHPEGVHDLRVAMRRLRSLLATLRPVVDQPEAERLRSELRWAGHELGTARDLEVVGARLEELVAAERVELVLGAVRARVEEHRRTHRREARMQVERLRASERYSDLQADLGTFLAGQRLELLTDDLARERLHRDLRRVRRRAARAEQRAGTAGGNAALHEVRKAAKRTRYAAEAMAPVFGRPAERLADRAKAVQQSLGDHRDTLLTRPQLRQLGVQAHLDGDNGFTFGRWHGLEEGRAADALDRYAIAARRLDKRKLRRRLD